MRSVSGDVFAARDTAAATACFFGAPDRKAAADKAASAAISSHRPEHRRNDAAASSGPTRFNRVAALSTSRNVRYANSLAARRVDSPRHPTTAPNVVAR